MKNRIALAMITFLGLVSGVSAHAAGPPPPDCSVTYELIFNMDKPPYASYTMWDAVYGEMDWQEKFTSGAAQDNGFVVAAGERVIAGEPDVKLLLVEFEPRGRVSWQQEHVVRGLRSVKKMLRVPGGFLVLGGKEDKSRDSVWLGFFDGAGKLMDEQTIADPQGDLQPEDIILAASGKGFLLSASMRKDNITSGVLFKLDEKGKPFTRSALRPGLDNRLLSLAPGAGNTVMASGFLRGDDGRLTGWLVQLDANGDIIWQRQYPRGSAAQVNAAAPVGKDYILAAGQTTPAGYGNDAGWSMLVDAADGDIIWQRYYTGEIHYAGRAVIPGANGTASILLGGRKPDKTGDDVQSYARILTLAPRGQLLVSEEIFSGEGAHAVQMIAGNLGERIVFGDSEKLYSLEAKPGEEPNLKRSLEGWVSVLGAMESYKDPCAGPVPPSGAP